MTGSLEKRIAAASPARPDSRKKSQLPIGYGQC
jgi:hypothetical protein